MDVFQIVSQYLETHGYDGLVSDDECACLREDLAPCGDIGAGCAAGYRVPCDCGDHDYHIQEQRPTDEKRS